MGSLKNWKAGISPEGNEKENEILLITNSRIWGIFEIIFRFIPRSTSKK